MRQRNPGQCSTTQLVEEDGRWVLDAGGSKYNYTTYQRWEEHIRIRREKEEREEEKEVVHASHLIVRGSHGRYGCMKCGAVGVKKGGMDFQAIAGQPSRIFVLTLSPPDAADPHIQFMSMISRILDAEGRERVLSADTREALWEALVGAGVR